MDHEPVLISTIALGLTAAFVGGLVAQRLRIPAIVGYIVAGVLIGPFTPGLTADAGIATELAEIGVILLMFGVGIHFSIRDLLAVRGIAIPGALGQITVATLLGVGLGVALGWGIGGGLVLGLAVSVASTVVLTRALMDRGELDTPQGRIAVGWLIVQDLVTVVVLVLLPTIAPALGGAAQGAEADATGFGPVGELALALGKAVLFAVLMIVAGARLVPWLLTLVARTASRELFTLAVLAIALGIAYLSSEVFGVSFALGAFLAGAVVGESDMSHQAAADALPLRDAFAVLFFVSVGMLLDPSYLLENPMQILAVVALITIAQPLVSFTIVALFGYPLRTALTVGAGLGQIGEFSFILGTMGLTLGLLPPEGFQLIVAGALFSIAINPFLFRAIEPLERRLRDHRILAALRERRAGDTAELPAETQEGLRLHAVLAGYGRVGRLIGPALERRGFGYVVITEQREEVDRLRARGIAAIYGDAANPEILHQARIEAARLIIVATSDPHETRLIVDRVRELNPGIDAVVRTHSDTEAAYLRGLGGKVQPVHGERELAVQMARYSMRRFGVSATEAEAIAQGLRSRAVAGSAADAAARPSVGWLERVRRWWSARGADADALASVAEDEPSAPR
ncbi:MAG TPA: cation:proton antiporter [Candidatus Saccharimonadales bacterium]|nr:cation:proton antiporter [Candidatus Saccharimonadales bacterium]